MEELIAQLRAAGFSDEEIAAHFAAREAPGRLESTVRGAGQSLFRMGDELEAMGRAISPNVTYDEALPRARARNEQARQAHPGFYYGGETAGLAAQAVGGAAFLPARMLLPAAIAAGAATGLGETNTPQGAVVGGGLGAAGYGAGQMVGRLGSKLADVFRPSRVASRQIGTQLTPEMVESAARQEQLAPGTVVPTDMHPQLTKMIRPVPQGRHGLATELIEEAGTRGQAIQGAMNQVAKGYPAADDMVPSGVALDRVLARRGLVPPEDGLVPAGQLMDLRTRLRGAAEAAAKRIKQGTEKAGDRQLVAQLREDASTITEHLADVVEGFRQTDKDYAILAEARRGAARTAAKLSDVRGTAGPNAVIGNTPASAGGQIANGSIADKAAAFLGLRGMGANAAAAAGRPMSPAQLAALMQASRQGGANGSLLALLGAQAAPRIPYQGAQP